MVHSLILKKVKMEVAERERFTIVVLDKVLSKHTNITVTAQ